MQLITKAAHDAGCLVGFDLAHAAGNINLQLHEWQVDFAVWCSYKYLNAGPGGIAASFVHRRAQSQKMPRFEGWWGHDRAERFKMADVFKPMATAEAWQLSNPPIFQLAALAASLEIFNRAGMPAIGAKRDLLTGFLEFLLQESFKPELIQTPSDSKRRGAQLSLKITSPGKDFLSNLQKKSVICDFREPDIIRAAPAPLYNSFVDVYRFVKILEAEMRE